MKFSHTALGWLYAQDPLTYYLALAVEHASGETRKQIVAAMTAEQIELAKEARKK